MHLSELKDVVVIGGGTTGLAAAEHLRRSGHSVVVIEAGTSLGGLLRSISIQGEPVEAYYHHVFPQDSETRDLIKRLGLSSELEWRRAPMAILDADRAYSFDSPLDILRFTPLSVVDRIRLGTATAVQLVRTDRARLDGRPVSVEGPRWFGRSAYGLVWRPLLEAKFGKDADSVPMAWLVSRIKQRGQARRAGADRLGYLRGSLGRLVTRFAVQLEEDGVEFMLGRPVERIVREGDQWVVNAVGQPHVRARSVIAAVSGQILGRLVDLPDSYAASLWDIRYRGVACVLVELDRPLSAYYWTNVTTRLGLGCVAIIEHTNFIPASRYGGRHLVYLAHYVGREDPAWLADAEDLLAAVEPAFRRLNPSYDRSWVRDTHLSRDPFAQPIPTVGGPMSALSPVTGLPGLFHASLAHIYPQDRGVSEALKLGYKVGALADAHVKLDSGA